MQPKKQLFEMLKDKYILTNKLYKENNKYNELKLRDLVTECELLEEILHDIYNMKYQEIDILKESCFK